MSRRRFLVIAAAALALPWLTRPKPVAYTIDFTRFRRDAADIRRQWATIRDQGRQP